MHAKPPDSAFLKIRVEVTRTLVLFLLAVAVGFIGLPTTAAEPTEVWVSDSQGVDSDDPTVANGTEQLPYKTIQYGIDKVAAGGTVKVKAGVYDEGETFGGGHSNRVAITKKVTIDGVDGKENTHIVGFRDFVNGNTLGLSATSVRCVYISSDAAGGILKNVTLRDGGTTANNGGSGYGGGVGGINTSTSSTKTSTFTLVDCVVSNCAAITGAGLDGVTAVRCLLSGNTSNGHGSAARFCNLVNCLVVNNRTSISTRAAVGGGIAVNCSVVKSSGTKAIGFGRGNSSSTDCKVYNCVSFGNPTDILSTSTVNSSYTTADAANMLYDPDNGDYRLSPGTVAVGGGRTEYLSVISLPDGVDAYFDYAGREIDKTLETCDAGCIQGYVHENEKSVTITADNGGIAVAGAVIGENALSVGSTVMIAPASGTRPCVGVSVNGVRHLFDDEPTINVDISNTLPPMTTISAIYTKDWYVDANAVDDNSTGFRPDDPKKTLASVLPLTSSGDTVHAASGRYEEGSYMLSVDRPCRAYVPAGVTLVADDGPDTTVIVGEQATEPLDGSGLGLGTNAMSCVCVGNNGHLRGFTLTGGHTGYYEASEGSSYSVRYAGGGVCGASEGDRDSIFVEDCVISNNCATFGGGAYAVNLIRCRVLDNKALRSGGGAVRVYAYGSVFDRNRQGTTSSAATCRSVTKLVGCTIGTSSLTLDGTTTTRAVGAVSSSAGQFHGCIFLGSVNDGSRVNFDTPSTYCIFTTTRSGFPTNEGCVVLSAAVSRALVDENLRPIPGVTNLVVDAWNGDDFATYASARLSTGKDLTGAPRIRNGRIDIGALESDPKPWYGKLLDGKGRHVAVMEADNMVTNIANGVTLQDGMAVSLTWSSAADDALRTGHVRVTGEGTLTVTKDGEPYATYTEADGEVEFSFAATGRSAAMQFSFAGEGAADVYSFSSPIGTLMLLK